MSDKGMTFVRCSSCRTLVPSDSDSCRMCGVKLVNTCPSCAEVVPATEQFCECGAEIPGGGTITRVGVDRRLVAALGFVVVAIAFWFFARP